MARTSSFRSLVPLGAGHRPACLGGAAVALAFGACDSPTAPEPASSATSRNVATVDTGYTHFAADVTVQVSRGTSGGTGRARTFQYHVDRVRDAAGQWSTTTTRANGAAPGHWRMAAARFAPDDVPASRPAGMATRSAATATADPGASWGRFHRSGRAAAAGPDALAAVPDEPLASPTTLGALCATLGQQYRLATTGGDGVQHYTRASGESKVDLALDPKIGHVQQVRVTRGGAVVLDRTYTFTRLADGIYARTAMRSQQLRRGRGDPVVTTATYTHMVFDHTAPTATPTVTTASR